MHHSQASADDPSLVLPGRFIPAADHPRRSLDLPHDSADPRRSLPPHPFRARRNDGTYEEWPRVNASQFIQAQRAARRGRGAAGAAMRLLLWPAETTATVLGA
jgi:hypothetical protein